MVYKWYCDGGVVCTVGVAVYNRATIGAAVCTIGAAVCSVGAAVVCRYVGEQEGLGGSC